MKKRVTLQVIADKVGVTKATVSMALRNHSRISESTQLKVKEVAERLGYRPDPALAALVSHTSRVRRKRNKKVHYGTFAYLCPDSKLPNRKTSTFHERRFEGIMSRAETLGYHVEIFPLQEKNLAKELKRTCSVLYHRGFTGVVLQAGVGTDLPLEHIEHFAWVTLGYSVETPKLHVIAPDYGRQMLETCQIALDRGYRRLGYVCVENSKSDTAKNWEAHFVLAQQSLFKKDRLPILCVDELDGDILKMWIQSWKPDCIISSINKIMKWNDVYSLNIPKRLGFLSLNAGIHASGFGKVSGVSQRPYAIGMAAIDVLHRAILANDLGIPEIRKIVMIDPDRVDGKTICSH
ncbi:MAG: LacI family DNA-binding transcriptional regulator [Verrucomicrobiota bacterium]